MKAAVILLLMVNAVALIVWFCSLRVRVVVGLPSGLPDRMHDLAGGWRAGTQLVSRLLHATQHRAAKTRQPPVQDPDLQRLNQAIRAVRAESGIAPALMPSAARSILLDEEPTTAARTEPVVEAQAPSMPEPASHRAPSAGEVRLIERMQRMRAAQNPAQGTA